MKKEQMILGERLETLCKEKGMSYYALSDSSTVPLNTLMHILHGKTKNPGFFTIVKLCDGLGVSLDEFCEMATLVEHLQENEELS